MSEYHRRTFRLYSDRAHYSPAHRAELSDILRPHWKDRPTTPSQIAQDYGLGPEDFEFVQDVKLSDIAVLPMTWNHYLRLGKMAEARRFIETARKCSRPVLSYVSGDEGVRIPRDFADVWRVRASGHREDRHARQIAQPVFFADPLVQFPQVKDVVPVLGHRSPSVGFCGQANARLDKALLDYLRCAARNIAFYLGLRLAEPQPLYPPSLLRARALSSLSRSDAVSTNFIERNRYRGGATNPESQRQTSLEFYRNIAMTHYTLCVRGGGNFSKRFYEVLAMGRIPILLDTGCVLPLDSLIDWDAFILRVPAKQIDDLPRLVSEHFMPREESSMISLQQRCRNLWLGSLTFSGFHRNLMRVLLGG